MMVHVLPFPDHVYYSHGAKDISCETFQERMKVEVEINDPSMDLHLKHCEQCRKAYEDKYGVKVKISDPY